MSEKSKGAAILILAAMFLTGALCGVGGAFYYVKQARPPHPLRAQEDLYTQHAQRMERVYVKSLDLTAEQKAAVHAEMESFAEAMKKMHRDLHPQFRALMGQRTAAIEKILTPEQLVIFRADRERYRQERDRKRSKEELERSGKKTAE